ncbi:hypothetical protein A3A21_02695 [Candidatus Jorgensenbacteria bacterium RIFCSPLOWO2_01_FULL_45_25b]|uniref:DUF5667 domain-containing protein n=1 Tax=Candidatus Jorgensenbacteria bacterium RIFCSPLOWO2_01_FULL_45_25b TaxID=1798471 RepID=A0A1F6BZT4_9BACT|nr:MAG: hypothetical protein A3A21_02695 [Candidatus Jorgensenbacteria bacterium RIFCSPLOWO2_01_FULL_45_25b]
MKRFAFLLLVFGFVLASTASAVKATKDGSGASQAVKDRVFPTPDGWDKATPEQKLAARVNQTVDVAAQLATQPTGVGRREVAARYMTRSRIEPWVMYIEAGVTDDPNFAKQRVAEVTARLKKKLGGKPYDSEIEGAINADVFQAFRAQIAELKAKDSAQATPVAPVVAGMTEGELARLKATESKLCQLLTALGWDGKQKFDEFLGGFAKTLVEFKKLAVPATVPTTAPVVTPTPKTAEAAITEKRVRELANEEVEKNSFVQELAGRVTAVENATAHLALALRDNDPEDGGDHPTKGGKFEIQKAATETLGMLLNP